MDVASVKETPHGGTEPREGVPSKNNRQEGEKFDRAEETVVVKPIEECAELETGEPVAIDADHDQGENDAKSGEPEIQSVVRRPDGFADWG